MKTVVAIIGVGVFLMVGAPSSTTAQECYQCEQCFNPEQHSVPDYIQALDGYAGPHEVCLDLPWCNGHPTCTAALSPEEEESVLATILGGTASEIDRAIRRHEAVVYEESESAVLIKGCDDQFRAWIPVSAPDAAVLASKTSGVEAAQRVSRQSSPSGQP